MALSDVASKFTDSDIPWRTCGVCHALENMSDGEAATLRDLLGNKAIKFKDLAAALEADPDTPAIPWETLSRHARGGCAARERLR
jgi:hypothetical protein